MNEWTSGAAGYVAGTLVQWGERLVVGNDLGKVEAKRIIIGAELATSLAAIGLIYYSLKEGNVMGAVAGAGFLASRLNWLMPE